MKTLLLRRTMVLIGATIVLCLNSYSQNGVTMLGRFDQHHGGPGGSYPFYYASCWGYVAPDGHEYALLGCYSGTAIIDIDANPMQEVAYIPGANSEWKELKTWGKYAYVVADVYGSQGLQIINLSQLPDTAWLVRSVTSISGRNITKNHSVSVADGFLYLNGNSAVSAAGVIILSLADPENPTFVGQYEPGYIHDCYVRGDTLYGAAIYGPGVYVASLANKAAPVTIGTVTYPGAGTHNTWVSRNGRYLFTTDEITAPEKNMKVFDIQNLPSFTQLTPFTANPSSVIHNIEGRGNYIYIAHYMAGVYVADIHDVNSIQNVGAYDTYDSTTHGPYIGCWGVYPYFPSGRWIASDTQTGLYLFTFTGLLPRIRSPLLFPATGDTLAEGATTAFLWRRATSQTEDPHYYQLHIWGPGVDTLMRSNDTSRAVASLPNYQNGQTYRWHVWIKDEYTSVSSQDTFQFVYRSGTVGVHPENELPHMFRLAQNYPNPFNPVTTISFEVGETGHVTLKVFNLLGQEVATLVNDKRVAGAYTVSFDASVLPSGIYLYRMTTAGGFGETKKMVLLR